MLYHVAYIIFSMLPVSFAFFGIIPIKYFEPRERVQFLDSSSTHRYIIYGDHLSQEIRCRHLQDNDHSQLFRDIFPHVSLRQVSTLTIEEYKEHVFCAVASFHDDAFHVNMCQWAKDDGVYHYYPTVRHMSTIRRLHFDFRNNTTRLYSWSIDGQQTCQYTNGTVHQSTLGFSCLDVQDGRAEIVILDHQCHLHKLFKKETIVLHHLVRNEGIITFCLTSHYVCFSTTRGRLVVLRDGKTNRITLPRHARAFRILGVENTVLVFTDDNGFHMVSLESNDILYSNYTVFDFNYFQNAIVHSDYVIVDGNPDGFVVWKWRDEIGKQQRGRNMYIEEQLRKIKKKNDDDD